VQAVEQPSSQAGSSTKIAPPHTDALLAGLASFLASHQPPVTLDSAGEKTVDENGSPSFLMTRTDAQYNIQFADTSRGTAEEDDDLAEHPVLPEELGQTTVPQQAGNQPNSTNLGDPPPSAVGRPVQSESPNAEALEAASAEVGTTENTSPATQDSSPSPLGTPGRGKLLTVITAVVTALGAYWAARSQGRQEDSADGWPAEA